MTIALSLITLVALKDIIYMHLRNYIIYFFVRVFLYLNAFKPVASQKRIVKILEGSSFYDL